MVVAYVLTFLLFGAGLWALADGAIGFAVFFLALATNFNLASHNHTLVHELLNSQRLLAMLVNKQEKDLAALRAYIIP